MGNFLYTIFVVAYSLAFRIAAIFNRKARIGLAGRKDTFNVIAKQVKHGVFTSNPGSSKLVWMHCASLGEFEQGRPVLEAVKKKFPQYRILLSFFSASGFEAMKDYHGADHIIYLPFDRKANAQKFIDAINPSLVLWVKYEYWFHYLDELRKRKVPVLLISGIFRDDQPFFKWYGGLWKQMLGCFTHLFVQNEYSKELLQTIGISNNVTISGDTRFDRVIEIAETKERLPLIEKFCNGKQVIVAGSTWEDDEAELTHYVKANPAIKFLIAPHETDAENIKDVMKAFPGAIRYSALAEDPTKKNGNDIDEMAQIDAHVLIIDNVGMLSRLYRYADITYVGGGFGAEGVHNVLEAAVYGKPVIHGPEFEKFAEAIELIEVGGAVNIQNALELEKVLNDLWEQPGLLDEKGKAAKDYVYSKAGAGENIIGFIQENRLLTN